MELRKISDNVWEIPKQGDMRVPAVIYSSARLLEDIRRDMTLTQARNVACLPGIERMSYVMPDAHWGYGFPIGGVAAFDLDAGIISPGGVGYDLNCGVRLLKTDYTEADVAGKRKELLAEIFKEVPAGVGKGGVTKLSRGVLKEILVKGAEWAVENGYGRKEDLERTEEYGRMKDAAAAFSKIAGGVVISASPFPVRFVSRGDNSGTNVKEKDVWKKAGIAPSASDVWYLSVGQGMGETLRIAQEKSGYTLADRGTYLASKGSLTLVIMVEGDPILSNPYHVMVVNPARVTVIKNYAMARKLVDFLVSAEAQKIITDFGKDKYGQPLFFPDAMPAQK